MDKFSYGLGLGIGQQLAQMGAEVNVDDFAQAIRDVLEGKETAVSFAENTLLEDAAESFASIDQYS